MDMSQWLASLRESFVDLSSSVAAYVPDLATALVVVAIGWLVARLLRFLTRHVVRRLEQLVRRRTGVEPTREQQVASHLVSDVVFWVVFLFFIAAATEHLGLAVVTQALAKLAGYLPAALGSVLIVLAALLLAELANRKVIAVATAGGLDYGRRLGQVAKVLILVIASVLALDQLGVNSTILVVLSATLFGAVFGGASLAFALGAHIAISNILASHYILQTYRVGQTVQVQNVTGRIVDIKPSCVVLDSPEGQVLVPAKTFSESVSVLVSEGR